MECIYMAGDYVYKIAAAASIFPPCYPLSCFGLIWGLSQIALWQKKCFVLLVWFASKFDKVQISTLSANIEKELWNTFLVITLMVPNVWRDPFLLSLCSAALVFGNMSQFDRFQFITPKAVQVKFEKDL